MGEITQDIIISINIVTFPNHLAIHFSHGCMFKHIAPLPPPVSMSHTHSLSFKDKSWLNNLEMVWIKSVR